VRQGLGCIGRQETHSGLPPNVQCLATLFGTAGSHLNASNQPHLLDVLRPGSVCHLFESRQRSIDFVACVVVYEANPDCPILEI
jgi:hypothetical protein